MRRWLFTVALSAVSAGVVSGCESGNPADPNDQVPQSIEIRPVNPQLQVGDELQFGATVRDQAGRTMSGQVITWSSTDSSVLRVASTGLATGASAGSVKVAATSGAVTDVTDAVVSDPGNPNPAPTNECNLPRAAWIWCDDFESNRTDAYFEYDDANGQFVRSEGIGLEGSSAMRAAFSAGQVSLGSLKVAFGRTPSSYFRSVDDGQGDYREIYWRVFVRNASGWQGGGGDKLARATVFAGSNWSQAMIAHIWSGSSSSNHDYLLLDPASGTDEQGNLITTKYNDFDNLRWLGSRRGESPLFADANTGQWYCVEAHVRLNDAGSSNGVFEYWIDDHLEARRADLNWVGSYAAYGLNAVFLENYWNAGSPRNQERYLDNFVISTERIGCGES